MNITQVYDNYLMALRCGDRRQALNVSRTAIETGVDLRDLYLEVFEPAMHEVGRLWESNQFTVAQEHLATAITQSVMAQLYTQIMASPRIGRSLVATCIGGELHELGIRMVADFFEIEGWDVYYLGANMPYDDVVQMVELQGVDLLAISVTLSSHVLQARELISAVRTSNHGQLVKIMVGGQPFNRASNLYASIGADFTASNAREAVQRAMEVLL